MSLRLSRRKNSRKVISPFKEPTGPILKFKWSISAAHLALLEENSSVIFPSINTNHSQRKIFAASSSLRDNSSGSQSSVSTYKFSPLTKALNKSQSQTLTEQNKNSTRNGPLLLSYAQLHRALPSPVTRSKQKRLSIYPIPDDKRNSVSIINDKRNSMSIINDKISFTPNPAVSSTTTISLLSNKVNSRLATDNLVRLHTPQLRRLNVSEKYLDEAKKLYFDADCRSFVPRLSITEVF